MRTIKFRGERLNDKEWAYGYLHECIGEAKLRGFVDIYRNFTFNKISLNCAWILTPRLPDSIPWGLGDTFLGYEVDSETVGQFTGLLDKNGVEIYEGDIIQSKMPISGELFNLEVAFKNGSFGTIGDITGELLPLIECDLTEYIVIGNIHDNPELLEGGDK